MRRLRRSRRCRAWSGPRFRNRPTISRGNRSSPCAGSRRVAAPFRRRCWSARPFRGRRRRSATGRAPGRFSQSVPPQPRRSSAYSGYRRSVARGRAACRSASRRDVGRSRRQQRRPGRTIGAGETALRPRCPRRRKRLAIEMREAGLLPIGVTLLGAVPVGGPHLRPMRRPGPRTTSAPRLKSALVDDRLVAAEHPMVGVVAFDARPRSHRRRRTATGAAPPALGFAWPRTPPSCARTCSSARLR